MWLWGWQCHWIDCLKVGKDIHGHQKMNTTDFGDALSFSFSATTGLKIFVFGEMLLYLLLYQ